MFGFETIEGTAGWYYKKWPGFLTLEAYELMEEYSMNQGQIRDRTSNKRKRTCSETEGVEEHKETCPTP